MPRPPGTYCERQGWPSSEPGWQSSFPKTGLSLPSSSPARSHPISRLQAYGSISPQVPSSGKSLGLMPSLCPSPLQSRWEPCSQSTTPTGTQDNPQPTFPQPTHSEPLANALSGLPLGMLLIIFGWAPWFSFLLLFVRVVPCTGNAMASALPSEILSTLQMYCKNCLLQEALPDVCS